MGKDDRTLTIAECIELWEKEGALNAKIAQLESECAGLRDNVDNLRRANQQLRINKQRFSIISAKCLKIQAYWMISRINKMCPV